MSSPDYPLHLQSPAVWDDRMLRASKEWRHHLDAQEIDELLGLLSRVEIDGDRIRVAGVALEESSPAHLPLPHTSTRIREIQDQLEYGTGAVWVRGIPVEELSEAEARVLYWAISSHLGTPVSQSPKGEKIFSVRDAGFAPSDPRARGPNTRKKLSFHTDRADVVGFLCLKQAVEGGENEVASSLAVYNAIAHRSPELLEILTRPFFYLRHSVDHGNDKPWCQQPVFSFCDGHFACCYLRVLIERAHAHPDLPELTVLQRKALDTIDDIASEPGMHLQFRQEPGDLLFMNNWVVLHRRREFVDAQELAERRHILRAWVAVPNSRPLDPLFIENFGATEAGAVRGGMRARSDL